MKKRIINNVLFALTLGMLCQGTLQAMEADDQREQELSQRNSPQPTAPVNTVGNSLKDSKWLKVSFLTISGLVLIAGSTAIAFDLVEREPAGDDNVVIACCLGAGFAGLGEAYIQATTKKID